MSIKIENVEISGWKAAIRGCRNPLSSWNKSDTIFISSSYCDEEEDFKLAKLCGGVAPIIKENDYKLLMNLCKGGSEESKWRRFVHVSIDITAPLYWWKEFDTYRIGTACNSCSTMHKIQAKKFTLEDFSYEHLNNFEADEGLGTIIDTLNTNRELFLKTKDKKYWWQMIQLLPTSYNQRRTIDLNYEVLAKQYRERKNHKLDEWREYCEWIKTLPYSELITMEEEMLTENICCNCHWYEGVKAIHGTAPCSKHNKQVLWNEGCDEILLIPERLKVEKMDTMEKIDGGICTIKNEGN